MSLSKSADENQLISKIGGASIIGRVGGTIGDIWGYKLKRTTDGQVIVDASGLPVTTDEIEYVGCLIPVGRLVGTTSSSIKISLLVYYLTDNMEEKYIQQQMQN